MAAGANLALATGSMMFYRMKEWERLRAGAPGTGRWRLFACGGAALLAAAATALSVGAYPVSVAGVVAVLGEAVHVATPWRAPPEAALVVLDLRLPRLLLAGLVGGGLAVAGGVMQALFRNPLADPALVGVSAGAALAAAAVLVLVAAAPPWALPLAAFAGGLAVTWLIYRLARYQGRTLPATLLLAGIAVNAMAGAGIGLLIYLADAPGLRNLTFWLLGSVARGDWTTVAVAGPLVLVCLALLLREARTLDLLSLGEVEAGHLGVDVPRLQRRLIALVALVVGACVAVSGIIGFIGLVVPHLLRLAVGPDHARLLPGCALFGAALLIVADTVARGAAEPAELPVGILTALIGAPFFLWLLLRHRGRVLW